MNTINLLSAISVLACNVGMATIPKQVNSNDYGDIVVINKDMTFSDSNSYTSRYGIGENAKDYTVYRQLSSYNDDRLSFYSERYYFESSYNTDGEAISFGSTTFFTIAIYENTLITDFTVSSRVIPTSSDFNVSGVRYQRIYNSTMDFTNLGNTLYFSNYKLLWEDNSLFPLVGTCSDSYLPVDIVTTSVSNISINDAIFGRVFSNNYNNDHGSINCCYTNLFSLDTSQSSVNISSFGIKPYGLGFTYKYYVNNPTYEVIDLPNVMLSILTMPFTFFSQAFNLTLFPNTPYAINVGHTILIVVGVIGSIYLIKYLVGIFKG